MISVEIRLISVIYIRCTVVSGYCVCVYRRYVVCVCVEGVHTEENRRIGDPWSLAEMGFYDLQTLHT